MSRGHRARCVDRWWSRCLSRSVHSGINRATGVNRVGYLRDGICNRTLVGCWSTRSGWPARSSGSSIERCLGRLRHRLRNRGGFGSSYRCTGSLLSGRGRRSSQIIRHGLSFSGTDYLSCGCHRLGAGLSLRGTCCLLTCLLGLLLGCPLSLSLSLSLLSGFLSHILHRLLRGLLSCLLGRLLASLLSCLFGLGGCGAGGFLLSHRRGGNCRGSCSRSGTDRHRCLSLLHGCGSLRGSSLDIRRSIGGSLLHRSNQRFHDCSSRRGGRRRRLLRGISRSVDRGLRSDRSSKLLHRGLHHCRGAGVRRAGCRR